MADRLEGSDFAAPGAGGGTPALLKVSIWELLVVLAGSLRLLALCLGCGLAAGILVSLLQSPLYRAQATLLPEEVSSRSGLVANVADRTSFWPIASRGTQVFYAAILRSRAVAEMVSERLRYGERLPLDVPLAERRATAVDRLRRSVTIREEARDRFYSGGGLISVSAEAPDPVAAADIANTYAYVLDEYLTENAVTSASRIRRFLEQRLEETEKELEDAQLEFQRFQEQYGAINIDEQAKATIQLLSQLEAQRVTLSVERVAQEERYSAGHSSVRALSAKIAALEEVIDRLTYSREEKVPVEREGKVEFFVPLQMIPDLSFEASRRLVILKSKEEIASLFGTRLEQAKIDEASDLPSVSVLDLATAGIRVRPKWKLNLAAASVLGLVVGCLGSWGRRYGTVAGPRLTSLTDRTRREAARVRNLARRAAHRLRGSRSVRADDDVRDG